jgi:hypothetical protein
MRGASSAQRTHYRAWIWMSVRELEGEFGETISEIPQGCLHKKY